MENPKGIIEEQVKKIDGYKTQIGIAVACLFYVLEEEHIWIPPEWLHGILYLWLGNAVRSMMKKFQKGTLE